MKTLPSLLFSVFALSTLSLAGPVPLSDGKTFDGWTGDLEKTWHVRDGAFVGGSLDAKVPQNEFLCTKKEFGNFELRLKVRLVGTEGFVNGGVQFRSMHIPKPPNELSGYQADMGKGWWGALYDESRRKKVLARPDEAGLAKALKPNDWNDYVVRCEGPHIQLWINGFKTVDYTETEEGIPQTGIIGLQVHGGGKTEAWYKDIVIEDLPAK